MAPNNTKIPVAYRIFFLYIEPVATLVGAFFAWFLPYAYLSRTDASSAPNPVLGVPTSTGISLRQLGNLYMVFALNEALVLRATTDIKVWRALLIALLIADFGHLYTVLPLGARIYYGALDWDLIHWGNVGFVYCGAATRICFLSGVGLGTAPKGRPRRKTIAAKASEDIELEPKTPMSTRARRKRAI